MAKSRSKRKHGGGFTLLELLVVITIMGLIVVALTGGVHFAGRAWEAQERVIDRQGDLDSVQNVLRQLIASGKNFEGDAKSLRFVGRMPRSLARGGLYDIDLSVSAERLVIFWQPHFKGASAAADPTETELAKNVSSLDLAYYVAQTDTSSAWQRSAKDKDKQPALIALALQTDDGRHWPRLIVAPMIQPDPNSK